LDAGVVVLGLALVVLPPVELLACDGEDPVELPADPVEPPAESVALGGAADETELPLEPGTEEDPDS